VDVAGVEPASGTFARVSMQLKFIYTYRRGRRHTISRP